VCFCVDANLQQKHHTTSVTPHPIPGPMVLTPSSSLGSYIVPTYLHGSFVRTLFSLMRTRKNFPAGHPSQIAPSQARLTWRFFFRDRLPKKKMHLVSMNTLLILLSLGQGYLIPGARISLRRPTSSSVNPNPDIPEPPSPHTPVKPRGSALIPLVTPRPIPGPTILTPDSSLGSYIIPTDQHGSFVSTLSSLMRTRKNFSVGHPSQIAPSQARLTWRFFRDRLPKKKMHFVGMNTLLILLSLGPGYPIQGPGYHSIIPSHHFT
jgi:hypothetical protein